MLCGCPESMIPQGQMWQTILKFTAEEVGPKAGAGWGEHVTDLGNIGRSTLCAE
jgi:hypothetical protein